MTTNDIIRLAREASPKNHDRNIFFDLMVEDLERFAALVAAAERESCAKVCDIQARGWKMNPGQNPQAGFIATSNCAAAIRNRGKE